MSRPQRRLEKILVIMLLLGSVEAAADDRYEWLPVQDQYQPEPEGLHREHTADVSDLLAVVHYGAAVADAAGSVWLGR